MKRATTLLPLLTLPALTLAQSDDLAVASLSPLMAFDFLPVVLIESLWLNRRFQFELRETLPLVAKANLVSTAISLPVAWLTGFVLQAGLSSTAGAQEWLNLRQGRSLFLLLLMVPAFHISVRAERWYYNWQFKGDGKARIYKAVRRANELSFLFLALLLLVWSYLSL